MKGNTYVIGDIHGALRALEQLMERIKPQKLDTLIFLGDYVDGWSESAGVIDYLMGLEQKSDCIFIKGNHDALFEDWMLTGAATDNWLSPGGGGMTTIESYKNVNDTKKALHLEFFSRMKMYVIDDRDRLFIHAGFTSMHGVLKEPHPTNVYWDRTLWEMAICMDSRIPKDSPLYPKRLSRYQEIFIGHTMTREFGSEVPMQGCNVWNVDTGAALQGKLSALNIDTKEFWQSDTCQSLYPDEKGRNK